MTTPILTSLAVDWKVPTHFTPIAGYGTYISGSTTMVFGFSCQHCNEVFRQDFTNLTSFDASVAALVSWCGKHVHGVKPT